MIFLVGLSHRSAPVDIRERLSAGGDALPAVLARLVGRPELAESMFISTCNRVEVVALAPKGGVDGALRAVREELARHGGLANPSELQPYLYEKHGEDAVTHLFRVASSLDSMVVGEPQILGQVKDAYDAAVAAGALKGMLGRCVSRAFTVAKRVRTETAIGSGSVSISSVAVDLARRVFGDLGDRVVLLLGAGEMAEAAARSLGKDARALRICNRSFDRAAALAGEMHASAVPWDGLAQELVQADVVVASTAATTAIVTRDMVRRAMKLRKGRTLLFVDIAVPRNIEPAVHGIDNVYVFNVDDLEHEVARAQKGRHSEVEAAERIVGAELEQFFAWTRGLDVQPTVVAMRLKVRATLLAELERSLTGRLRHLGEGDRATLTQMMESAANKLLHLPTTNLKARAAESDDGAELAAAVRFLFDLEEVGGEKARGAAEPASASERVAVAASGEGPDGLPH